MGSVGGSFFQGRLQLDKTRRRQALRQVPPVHLHGKALPKLLRSFGFAKTSFFGLSSTLAKLVLFIVHNLATPMPSMTTQAGKENSERQRCAG